MERVVWTGPTSGERIGCERVCIAAKCGGDPANGSYTFLPTFPMVPKRRQNDYLHTGANGKANGASETHNKLPLPSNV